MESEKEELTDIIAIARYPRAYDEYITADCIADAVLEAGFTKKPIKVTRRMIHQSLLKFYPGINSVRELNNLEQQEKAMGDAIYAAWSAWKLDDPC